MLRSIRSAIPNVHREGWPFIAATLALALVFAFLIKLLSWLFLILAGWMVVFFRDPVRVVPVAPGLVVSPADGRVEPVVSAAPPPELGLGEEPRTRVSIFMSVFDCHINRAPVAGRIARIAYRMGQFLSADLDKASEANERNGLVIEVEEGLTLGVVQIAGLVARRIGMIRFGSRVDIYLPEGATVVANPGQRAVAGETIVALLPGAALAPPFPVRSD